MCACACASVCFVVATLYSITRWSIICPAESTSVSFYTIVVESHIHCQCIHPWRVCGKQGTNVLVIEHLSTDNWHQDKSA